MFVALGLPAVVGLGCRSVMVEGDQKAGHRVSEKRIPYETIGTSVEGRPIEAVTFGSGREHLLIFAGIHGDEPHSVFVARQLIAEIAAKPELVKGRRVTIVPEANPDGVHRGTRGNARRIDVNRNFPASNFSVGDPKSRYFGGDKAASEPETQTLIALVRRLKPSRIVSIHSIGGGRHCNNYDGPASDLAAAMSRHNGYPATATMGYPTPGSFGTWAGIDLSIPTITLEVPSSGQQDEIWQLNRSALHAFIGGGAGDR